MKIRYILLLLACCFSSSAICQKATIIPAPQHLNVSKGSIVISPSDKIAVSKEEHLPIAEILLRNIYFKTGIELACTNSKSQKQIIEFVIDTSLAEQSYKINIDKKATIYAANYEGFTLGASTILQLIKKDGSNLTLPKLEIYDHPELEYRGMMLDNAREWIPYNVIIQTLDLMHIYKFNYLHFHLSDMDSYTLPSKAYPNLPSVFEDGSRRHYTPEEIGIIVDHAKNLGITLIPEIDVPGHAGQLVGRVPEVFSAINPNTDEYYTGFLVNMVSEKTYEGYEVLVQEMIELFPNSPYIHIGADEVISTSMRSYPGFKEYCEKYNLKETLNGNMEELFAHFISRVNDIVNKYGKKSIIWEGFADMGTENARIPENMIVQAWTGSYQSPQSLVDNGFEIVNCTWLPMYYVQQQNRYSSQEMSYKWNYRLFEVHQNDVEPIQVSENVRFHGAQICFWEHTHEMVIPLLYDQIAAISERIWNPESGKTFEEFKEDYKEIEQDVKHIIEPVNITVQGFVENSAQNFTDSLTINLSSIIEGNIRYALVKDYDTIPSINAPVYDTPLKITETTFISAQVFDENNNPIGGVSRKKFFKIIPAYTYEAYSSYTCSAGEKINWEDMPDFPILKSDRNGLIGFSNRDRVIQTNRIDYIQAQTMGNVDIRPENMWCSYGIDMKGQINIPKDGKYEIKIHATDGGVEIYLDKQNIAKTLILGDEIVCSIDLQKGVFPLQIKYFYRFIFNQLNIQVKIPGSDVFQPFEQLVIPISEHKPAKELDKIEGKLIYVIPEQLENWNLALNKPVTTTAASQSTPSRYMVDGITSNPSGFEIYPYPQIIEIDLGSPHVVDSIIVVTYNNGSTYYQYTIEASSDNIDWREVVDMSQNKKTATKDGYMHKIKPRLTRFIKINVLKNSGGDDIHINEIMVYSVDDE